jgi:hypothetical protein
VPLQKLNDALRNGLSFLDTYKETNALIKVLNDHGEEADKLFNRIKERIDNLNFCVNVSSYNSSEQLREEGPHTLVKHQQVQTFWRKNLRGSPDCKVKPFVEWFTDFFELDLLKNSNKRYERFIYRLDEDKDNRVNLSEVNRRFPPGKHIQERVKRVTEVEEPIDTLPASTTHFVRRADETKELKNAINTCRLITVYAEKG